MTQVDAAFRNGALASVRWPLSKPRVFALAFALIAAASGYALLRRTSPAEPVGAEVPGSNVAVALDGPPSPGSSSNAQTSALVYIKSVTDRRYGWLARQFGMRDGIESRVALDPAKPWWENPTILHLEPAIADPDVTGEAECAEIKGSAVSANVEVSATLICHAKVALKTRSRSDCMKGTITAMLNARTRFYDDLWTDLVNEKNRTVVFSFDTTDKTRRLRETGTDRRVIQISIECYRRDRRKWERRSDWPDAAERGDILSVITVRDATLEVTGYAYDDSAQLLPSVVATVAPQK